MKIAVLGSSGGMGRYFVKRFVKDGHQVAGFDVRVDEDQPEGLAVRASNREAARNADAVVIATPTRIAAKVARDVASSLRRGAVLVEISSLKGRLLKDLRAAVKGRDVVLLSVHPMFGPSSAADRPKVLVLGTTRDIEEAERLFPWARLIQVPEREHDRLMAYALNLVHFTNLAFASTVAKGIGAEEFSTLASPFGLLQITLAEAILSEDPSLFAMIQSENPFSSEAVRSFIDESKKLLRVIEGKKEKDFVGLFATLAGEFPREQLEGALARVYSSFG